MLTLEILLTRRLLTLLSRGMLTLLTGRMRLTLMRRGMRRNRMLMRGRMLMGGRGLVLLRLRRGCKGEARGVLRGPRRGGGARRWRGNFLKWGRPRGLGVSSRGVGGL